MHELLTLPKMPENTAYPGGFKSESVGGFMSERWPTSNRNPRPASVGIHTPSLEWRHGGKFNATSLAMA